MPLLKRIAYIRRLKRLAQISRILINHGFKDFSDRLFRKKEEAKKSTEGIPAHLLSGYPNPIRIRKVLEELGPSFIKLGQLMSTRADVLPKFYIDELKKLQDQIPPLPFSKIKPLIESELSHPLNELFAEISEKAIAAASIAQVHKARLHSGEKVVIKVVRPGTYDTIRDDIGLMYFFAEKFEKRYEFGRLIGAINLVKEFERTIFKELDMLIEAGNIERFITNFKNSNEIKIPTIYWDYTSKSILTMEHIPGVRLDQVEAIIDMGLDPKKIARIGLRSFSLQLMEFGFFHGDPHPANTIVMPDGRVGMVDFGIVGYLDEELMRQIAYLFLGFAEHDYSMVIDSLIHAGIIDENTIDLHTFRQDLKEVSEPFYGRSLKTISVRDVYDQVMMLVFKYQIRLPRNLLLLFKTFIQTEALGKILESDASLLEVTRPYAKKLLEKGYHAQEILRNLGSDAKLLGRHLKSLPKLFNDILKKTVDGTHQVQVKHNGFEKLEVKLEKGLNRFIVGIVISASTIAGALVLNVTGNIKPIYITLFTGDTITLTALLGLTGYSIATILGVWLIISIFRSGKL